MARGFEAALAKVKALPPEADAAAVLKTVGMALISTVAAPPVRFTARLFCGVGSRPGGRPGRRVRCEVLEAAINALRSAARRPAAKRRCSTPSNRQMRRSPVRGSRKPLADCLDAACEAAEKGIEYTKTIIATKGRASYLGERSLGHQDPGATSSYIILKALADFCRRRDSGGN
jgi:dihydroxyacetone kinase-like protein